MPVSMFFFLFFFLALFKISAFLSLEKKVVLILHRSNHISDDKCRKGMNANE